MKKILTHLLAFILGIIALPLLIYATIQISPGTISTIVQYAISPSCPSERGVAALKNAKNEEERFYYLGAAAKEAFEAGEFTDAKAYAIELESLTPKYKENWNYGNAIQDFHVVLGRLELKDGHIEEAKKHLISAGKSPGSPQMNSFGPNMSLAKDLLKHKEDETVIEYLTLCKSFWEMHDGQLDKWIILVKAGEVPEFGTNLLY